MATRIDKTTSADKEDFLLCWARGDDDPRTITVKSAAGVVIDISTWTLSMAVNTDKDPTVAAPGTVIFQVAGVLVDEGSGAGVTGKVSFTPPAASLDNVTAGQKAFYDIQRITPSRKTLVKGNVTFLMDIDKT
jgi:hypothetical protein